MSASCPQCGSGPGPLPIHDVEVYPALDPRHRATGLIGWAAVLVGPFRFDGLAIRRRQDGLWIVTWPARRDSAGRLHPCVIAIDDDVRQHVADAVLAEARRVAP